MFLTFTHRKQPRDVVVVQAVAQAERPGLGSVGLRFGWRQDLVEAETQCVIDHIFERTPELRRPLAGFGGDIRI